MDVKGKIVYVNNTRANVDMFHKYFLEFIFENKPLPEEISDLFDIKIVEVNGERRGIINFA